LRHAGLGHTVDLALALGAVEAVAPGTRRRVLASTAPPGLTATVAGESRLWQKLQRTKACATGLASLFLEAEETR